MDALTHTKLIRELSKTASSLPGPLPAGPEAGVSRRGWAGIGRALEVEDGRLRLVLGVLLIFALVLIAYRPILPGSFLMDDRRLIEEDNPMVTGQLGPSSVWFQTEWAFSTFVFWAQWLAWGAKPGCYHAVNMALHALSAVLLWRLLARLRFKGAWLAGALFAVHPVAVASVARIAELKNTLSLPFFLLATLFYVRYEDASLPRHESNPERQGGPAALWYGLSLAAFVLALLSKTSTVMLPLLLLGGAAFRRGRVTGRDVICTGPFFALALAFGLMSAWFQKHLYLPGLTLAPESFGERLALAGRAFWFYLGKAFLPVNLNLVYPRWKVDASSLVSFLPVLLIGAAFLLCWRFRRAWGRPALFGMGAFAVGLFPALGLINSQFLTRWQVSDHLQYLPLIAPVALAAAALAAVLPARIFRGAAAALVLALTLLAFQRAEAFATPERLFRDTLAKNPDDWAASNDLGVILAARADYPAAIGQFKASLQSNPDNPDAHANLAQTLALQGKFAQADPEFRQALALQPLDARIHRNFAAALGQQGKQGEAVRHLQTALSLKPDLPTRLELAGLFFQESDLLQAEKQYRQALRFDPDCLEALNNLGWLLATASDDKLRDGPEAVRLAERALRLPPAKGMCVAGTLAAAYAEAGRFPEAIATAEKAVREETAAGETRFADLNRQLLTLYRAGKPWHGTIAKNASQYGVSINPP
ncbi:MAG: tetratricopeptide repeat protein [Verrucomicrobiota bacterium]|jgi:tetratricopeptide (TPR) repeat protein